MRCEIKVQARIYATLIRLVPERISERYPQGIRAGLPLEVEMPEGSTLADLVDHFALPREKVRVVFVNGRAQQLDHRLAPGDQVGIDTPTSDERLVSHNHKELPRHNPKGA